MRALVSAVTVFVACALGACGGDGDAASKDKKQIRSVVTEVITTTDPSACTRLTTQTFLEQTTGAQGSDAVRTCRRNATAASAQSVSIGRVAVSGPRASADVRPKGGSLAFTSLRIGLRKTTGRWKIDRAKSGTLDRAAFFRLSRRELTSPPNEVSPAIADCVLREFKAIDDDEIVQALINMQQRLFVVAGAICGFNSTLAGSALPKRTIACIERRFRHELTGGAIGRRVAANPDRVKSVLASPRSSRTVRLIGRSCAQA